ncbi:MAG: hypothetical protein IJY93_04430 [Clostridia bacterium]|nr:hypothetical protein [Clostridia bacterium]
MKKVPISLQIDDPAPIISVYHEHATVSTTTDGRPIIPTFPNSFLDNFCDVIEKHGIKGKFSIVPMPGNKGDIVNGLEGVPREELDYWMDTVKKRVAPLFTIGPEMLTHHKPIDLATGKPILEMNEEEWSFLQDRTTLTPYIGKALSLLKEAGFNPIGVTSPWKFGIKVEDEYHHAISQAVYDVTGSKNAWFMTRGLYDMPNARPWVELDEDGRTLVSIPPSLQDRFWRTMNTTRTDDEYVNSIADMIISEDGKSGEMIYILETNGFPIIVTHWQSLNSNGLETGLRVLDVIASRVNKHLSDRVEWMSFEEIMNLVLANKEAFPKPENTGK